MSTSLTVCLLQVSVVVTDKMWVDGKMVQETRYESEKEIDAPQEEEGEDTPEWDMEEEEVRTGRGHSTGGHVVPMAALPPWI